MDKSQKQFVIVAVIFLTLISIISIVKGIDKLNEKRINDQIELTEKKIQLEKKFQRMKMEEEFEKQEREEKEKEYKKIVDDIHKSLNNIVKMNNEMEEINEELMKTMEITNKMTKMKYTAEIVTIDDKSYTKMTFEDGSEYLRKIGLVIK